MVEQGKSGVHSVVHIPADRVEGVDEGNRPRDAQVGDRARRDEDVGVGRILGPGKPVLFPGAIDQVEGSAHSLEEKPIDNRVVPLVHRDRTMAGG